MITAQSCDMPTVTQEASCPFTCIYEDEDDFVSQLMGNLLKGEVPYSMDDDGHQMWIDFVCGGDAARVFGGDHAESASPTDPSFWPV